MNGVRKLGLFPNLIVCRSKDPIDDEIKEKISKFCGIELNQIVTIHDVSSVYQVPLIMEEQGVVQILKDTLRLDLKVMDDFLNSWRMFAEKIDNLNKSESENFFQLVFFKH